MKADSIILLQVWLPRSASVPGYFIAFLDNSILIVITSQMQIQPCSSPTTHFSKVVLTFIYSCGLRHRGSNILIEFAASRTCVTDIDAAATLVPLVARSSTAASRCNHLSCSWHSLSCTLKRQLLSAGLHRYIRACTMLRNNSSVI